MGNPWVFPSIFHSTKKSNKIHLTRRTWETGAHTFPIEWALFFHYRGKIHQNNQMSIAWEISSHTFSVVWVFFQLHSHPVVYFIIRKVLGFPHQFPIAWENVTKPRESLGNWYSYFFHSMSSFLQPDSHPVTYFLKWEMIRFRHQFPLENAAKSIKLKEPGKLVHIFSPVYGYFFHQIQS